MDGCLLATLAWVDHTRASGTEKSSHGVWEYVVLDSSTGEVWRRQSLPSPHEMVRIGPRGMSIDNDGSDDSSMCFADSLFEGASTSGGRPMMSFSPVSYKLVIATGAGIVLWDGDFTRRARGEAQAGVKPKFSSHEERRLVSGMTPQRRRAHKRMHLHQTERSVTCNDDDARPFGGNQQQKKITHAPPTANIWNGDGLPASRRGGRRGYISS